MKDNQLVKKDHQIKLSRQRFYSFVAKPNKPWWIVFIAGLLMVIAKYLLSH